jgi:protein gp37
MSKSRLTDSQIFVLLTAVESPNGSVPSSILCSAGAKGHRKSGGVVAWVAFPTMAAANGLARRGLMKPIANAGAFLLTEEGRIALADAHERVAELVDRTKSYEIRARGRAGAHVVSDKTGISWTDATWNLFRGCSRVSEGCRHCYAESIAKRFSGPGQPYAGLVRFGRRERPHAATLRSIGIRGTEEVPIGWNGEVRLIPTSIFQPMRWTRPRRIFVNSMSDMFHERLSNEEIAIAFGVMAAAPWHTFQILTKRAARMHEWFAWIAETVGPCTSAILAFVLEAAAKAAATFNLKIPRGRKASGPQATWPLANVWLGVSVENQAAAGERVNALLATPAAIRFISCEPLLGPVDLAEFFDPCAVPCGEDGTDTLDWIIAGCESGAGARACDVAWLRSLRDQAGAESVPFFLKQAVEPTPHDQPAGLLAGIRHFPARGPGKDGSKRKRGGVIELPYLDGSQWAEFPAVRP